MTHFRLLTQLTPPHEIAGSAELSYDRCDKMKVTNKK